VTVSIFIGWFCLFIPESELESELATLFAIAPLADFLCKK